MLKSLYHRILKRHICGEVTSRGTGLQRRLPRLRNAQFSAASTNATFRLRQARNWKREPTVRRRNYWISLKTLFLPIVRHTFESIHSKAVQPNLGSILKPRRTRMKYTRPSPRLHFICSGASQALRFLRTNKLTLPSVQSAHSGWHERSVRTGEWAFNSVRNETSCDYSGR